MREKSYSVSIANAISAFLVEDDWKFSFNEQLGLFNFGLGISGRLKKVNYTIDVKDDEFIVYGYSPIGADIDDTEAMSAMTNFICRANYGLKNGNFELDVSDGEIRYKCYVDCADMLPNQEIVKHTIHCVAAMFMRYGQGIVDIIFGGASAEEAIAKCE